MIYLSGAMGCFVDTDEAEYPYIWRNKVEEYIEHYGKSIKIFNPTKFYDYKATTHNSDEEIMRYELSEERKCDVVLLDLYRLNDSDGTKCEIVNAYLNNIPVIAYGTNKDYCKLHPWIQAMIHRYELDNDSNHALENALYYIVNYYYY